MVWEQYVKASGEAGLCAAAYTTFLRYWRELAPHVIVMKPMTDLCWVCQKNSSAIMKAKNMPDEMKSAVSILNIKILPCFTHMLFRQYELQKNI